LVGAQAAGVADVPSSDVNGWGCDDAPGTTVDLVGPDGTSVAGPYPCFDFETLADQLDAKGLAWRYYTPSTEAIWSAYNAIRQIHFGPDWSTDIIAPETRVLTDVPGPSGSLATMTWITPDLADSDHPGSLSTTGPQWVASVIDAIGESKYWNSTAIFVLWDDWGGWYDHVSPPQLDSEGLGFRVPLLVVSPYAKAGYVSHVEHEVGSLLKFTEEVYGFSAMAASDARADDLSDCFNFAQPPRPFVTIPTELRRPSDFERVRSAPYDPRIEY
jgi:phospholipase C